MRLAAATFALAALLTPSFAWSATPEPLPNGIVMHKSPAGTFSNPGKQRKKPPVMNGQGCIANHPNATQNTTNPITGKPQAAPLVGIPIGGGSVSDATTRSQQAHACAHYRT